MSMQSNVTIASGDIPMIDANDSEDMDLKDNLTESGASKVTKGAKKGGKCKKAAPRPKRKASAAQQAETVAGSSFVEPEDDDFEVKVEQQTAKGMNERKRKSDESSVYHDPARSEVQPRPTKRRATRSSVSHGTRTPISTLEFGLDDDPRLGETENMTIPPPASKKASKGGRKRASTSARKASAASTASKASLRAPVPDTEDIDAALEADLDRPLTDDEADLDPPPPKTKSRRLTRTRPGSRSVAASTAPVRRTTRASTIPVEQNSMLSADHPTSNVRRETAEEVKAVESALNAVEHAKEEIIAETGKNMASKTKARGRAPSKSAKASKKITAANNHSHDTNGSHQDEWEHPLTNQSAKVPETNSVLDVLSASNPRTSQVSVASTTGDHGPQIDSSMIVPVAAPEDSSNKTDVSVADPSRFKKGEKKRTVAAKKGKVSQKGATASYKLEEIVRIDAGDVRRNSPDAAAVEVELPDDNEQATLPGLSLANKDSTDAVRAAKPKKGKAAKPKAGCMLSPVGTPSVEHPEPARIEPMAAEQERGTLNTTTPPDSQDPEDDHASVVRSGTPQAQALPVHETPKKVVSPQSSDAENQPPSSRPSALRPPLTMLSPSKAQITRIVLDATTPTSSPFKRNISRLQSTMPWTAIDFEKLLAASPATGKENFPNIGVDGAKAGLSSPERKLSVEQWMRWKAERGEQKLREDCERLVGRFEGEGVRALKTLEGIVCSE
ncbi:MAG: hypothetical protein Q9201_004914 [Fulgogasparrea decipioides]